jgi:hypothetical protein
MFGIYGRCSSDRGGNKSCFGLCHCLLRYMYRAYICFSPRVLVYHHYSVDEFFRGAPGRAWGGEARVLQEVVEFTVSVRLTPKVMFN